MHPKSELTLYTHICHQYLPASSSITLNGNWLTSRLVTNPASCKPPPHRSHMPKGAFTARGKANSHAENAENAER